MTNYYNAMNREMKAINATYDKEALTKEEMQELSASALTLCQSSKISEGTHIKLQDALQFVYAKKDRYTKSVENGSLKAMGRILGNFLINEGKVLSETACPSCTEKERDKQALAELKVKYALVADLLQESQESNRTLVALVEQQKEQQKELLALTRQQLTTPAGCRPRRSKRLRGIVD